MATAADVLAVAVREIGTVEQSGNRQKYGKSYGMDGVYWCMQFVCWCFQQVEGLYIDKDVSFTDLKQVLLTFAREMFGPETKIRLRPSYFPFTEPSAEMDISCNICGGKGCSFCKHTGWVEILGCGMVDPNVLEANGIDSKKYKGYAFGMGVERITNLKYQVKDLRLFSENDVRFLDEFVSAN